MQSVGFKHKSLQNESNLLFYSLDFTGSQEIRFEYDFDNIALKLIWFISSKSDVIGYELHFFVKTKKCNCNAN